MKYVLLIFFSLFILPLQAQDYLPKSSIYHLKSKWKNIEGKEVTLRDFQGQKVLIAMVYTKCPHACPMIISKITSIENEIKKKSKDDFKIIIASFDHKRDTPQHLNQYVKQRKLDESRWIFLSSPDEATARTLAVVLGISFKELEDGEFSHSNTISLLSESGIILTKLDNLNAGVDPFVEAFKKRK